MSDMPRLILHVGMHKTGTTAVQAFAQQHRDALCARGLWYPPYYPTASGPEHGSHNRLARALAAERKRRADAANEAVALLHRWASETPTDTVLLSAEAFSRHVVGDPERDWTGARRAYLERVAEALRPFGVEVLITLRRQDAFVHSDYIEHIAKGTRRARWSFAAYRAYLMQRHLRYEDNLALYAELFGKVRVTVYDDLRAGEGLCGNFFRHLGVDTSGLAAPGYVRRSLSPPQARLKRALLPVIVSKRQNRWCNDLVRSGLAHRVIEARGLQRDAGFWSSDDERLQWLGRYAAENESIRRRFLPERAELFPS